VVTQAPTASAAIEQNARRMTSVRAALRRAGIADRDIQTSNVSLNPDYRYVETKVRNSSATGPGTRLRSVSATSPTPERS
jgi:uncharacterized protein YggE